MRVSVFGLGYVGAVTSACLARDGHAVVGVDLNPEKVALIAAGQSPIIEPGLGELLSEGRAAGRIRATTDAGEAVAASDASLISVGTPKSPRGHPDLSHVFHVCEQIGAAVARHGGAHVVVLRSTVPPGTLARCREVLTRAAGDMPVPVAFNPEFLREGSAIADYDSPPFTIIGTRDALAEQTVRAMYARVDAPVVVVEPAVAEMVKYVSNAWHASKVVFANEVGRIAKAFEVDGRQVMDLVIRDTKLNISPAYLRPGFAYGGSCLPKDLDALLHAARVMDVPVPLLSAIPTTNGLQVDLAATEVLRLGARRVALLGLAFKPGTDDLRESPAVQLVKRLIGEGRRVQIYDRAVYQARLMGTNLAYIRDHLPHFEDLLVPDLDQAVRDADIVVVSYRCESFRRALLEAPAGTRVLDLVGLFDRPPNGLDYHGLAW